MPTMLYEVSIGWYHDLQEPSWSVALCDTLEDALACFADEQQRGDSDFVTLTPHIA